MKLKFEKVGNEFEVTVSYRASILRGKGGISSLIYSKQSKNIITALLAFLKVKYIFRALTWN